MYNYEEFQFDIDMNSQKVTIWFGGNFTEESFETIGATSDDEEYEVVAFVEDFLSEKLELERMMAAEWNTIVNE